MNGLIGVNSYKKETCVSYQNEFAFLVFLLRIGLSSTQANRKLQKLSPLKMQARHGSIHMNFYILQSILCASYSEFALYTQVVYAVCILHISVFYNEEDAQ